MNKPDQSLHCTESDWTCGTELHVVTLSKMPKAIGLVHLQLIYKSNLFKPITETSPAPLTPPPPTHKKTVQSRKNTI